MGNVSEGQMSRAFPKYQESSYDTPSIHMFKHTCLLEMFKINKLESPAPLLDLFHRSPRRTDRFITPTPSTSFIYQSTKMWNDCRNTASKINFSTSTNLVKSTLRSELLSIQSRYDEIDWCELNFDSKELKF